MRFLPSLTAAAAAIVLVTACGAGPATPRTASTRSQTNCDGVRVLEVQNQLDTPVDVYAYPAGGGAGSPTYLGTANRGTDRIVLSGPVGYTFARVNGRNVTSASGVTPVRYRFLCE